MTTSPKHVAACLPGKVGWATSESTAANQGKKTLGCLKNKQHMQERLVELQQDTRLSSQFYGATNLRSKQRGVYDNSMMPNKSEVKTLTEQNNYLKEMRSSTVNRVSQFMIPRGSLIDLYDEFEEEGAQYAMQAIGPRNHI